MVLFCVLKSNVVVTGVCYVVVLCVQMYNQHRTDGIGCDLLVVLVGQGYLDCS